MADTELSADERRELGEIAGTMIPADPALGMPGADDPLILADIVTSIGRDLPLVRDALVALAAQGFAGLDRARREALINEWYAGRSKPAAALGRAILGAYYRDDRVLKALGHEARAPFPKGYEVEQGDWSLLEIVKQRPAFWRQDKVR